MYRPDVAAVPDDYGYEAFAGGVMKSLSAPAVANLLVSTVAFSESLLSDLFSANE